MGFQKAKKEQIWVKVLLNAPSGGGKTYSALRLATGLSKKCGSRVAALDTENRRIRYYASEFDFDDMQLEAPYSLSRYQIVISWLKEYDLAILYVAQKLTENFVQYFFCEV